MGLLILILEGGKGEGMRSEKSLDILIPARHEEFLKNTIEDILRNMRGDTEVIAVLDGEWAKPPIDDHPSVTLIYHPESIGQRAATNEAAHLSYVKGDHQWQD